MSKKKKLQPRSFLEVYQSLRGNWNGVNPITKVIKDKTAYSRKDKHKQKYYNAMDVIEQKGE